MTRLLTSSSSSPNGGWSRFQLFQGGSVVGIVTQKDVTSAMTLLGEAREQIVGPDGTLIKA